MDDILGFGSDCVVSSDNSFQTDTFQDDYSFDTSSSDNGLDNLISFNEQDVSFVNMYGSNDGPGLSFNEYQISTDDNTLSFESDFNARFEGVTEDLGEASGDGRGSASSVFDWDSFLDNDATRAGDGSFVFGNEEDIVPQSESSIDLYPDEDYEVLVIEPLSEDLSMLGATTADELTQFDPETANSEAVIGDPASSMEVWEYQGDTNRCALHSQKCVIEEITGQDINIEKFVQEAESEGVFVEEEGTYAGNIDAMLDNYGVESKMTFDNSISNIESCLESGNKVIVSVDSGEIWNGETETTFNPYQAADHVVEVIGIDQSDPDNPMVILNDSGIETGCGEMVPLDTFVDAWEDGGCQMVECYAGDANSVHEGNEQGFVSESGDTPDSHNQGSFLGKEFHDKSTEQIAKELEEDSKKAEKAMEEATRDMETNANWAADGLDETPHGKNEIDSHIREAEAAARDAEEDRHALNQRTK